MFEHSNETTIKSLLRLAGVEVNGHRPWDIRVDNPELYRRVLAGGSLALGESYLDGWWEAEQLDQFFYRVFQADLRQKIKTDYRFWLNILRARLLNLQKRSRAFQIGERHYDVGDDVYRAMLGATMTYTCAYWRDSDNLDQAQNNKLDLVCRKIGLQAGDRVLDIGCGWGSFAKFAAKNYGAEVVGITVSRNQAAAATAACRDLPVEIRLQDYREVNEKFDNVVSLGMFEHVGCKNYQTYLEVVHRNLRAGGLFLLHTIGGNRSVWTTEPWIGKYIFPNSMIPSIKQIGQAMENLFVMEDWHNFGVDYDRTLMAWHENFVNNWYRAGERDEQDERFLRMWRYYLLACAASFRARKNQLWQIVLSKEGMPGGYRSIR